MDRSAPVRKPCCYPPNLSRAKNESEDDPPSSQRTANRLADGVDQSSRVDAEPLWPICFTQGQDFNFHTFNQPCVDLLRQQWLVNNELSDDGQATGKDDEGSDEGSDDESDDGSDDDSCGDSDSEGDNSDDLSRVRIFMRQDNEHHGTYRGQVRVVESFCAQIDVNDFEAGGAAGETERNALLDERTEIGEARMDRGPMDSLQLFNALSQKRFTSGISTATSQGMACTETGHSEPNAARRTLYITNLNPHGAAALCMTTSLHEAPMVRDLLHEHLIRSTEVGVLLPAHGYPTFTIKIHLSFYTLTRGQKPDSRRWPDGSHLRSSLQLPHLPKRRPRSDGSVEDVFAQEAQTSIALTGLDEWRWTAIGLVDTPHKKVESAQYYHLFSNGRGTRTAGKADPLTRGEVDANFLLHPRLYFLRIWKAQISHVSKEWKGIVRWLEQSIKQACFDDIAAGNAQATVVDSQIQVSIATKSNIMSLSKLLRHDLLKTVSAWRQFSKHDIKYFQDGGVHFQEVRLMADCLRGIEAIYSSLEVTLEDWKQLDNSFGDQHLSNSLSAYNIEVSRQIQALSSRTLVLNGDSLDLVRAQKKSGDSMQNLTVISIYFLPLVLASSLFSMTPGTLPFDTTITAFIAVWIILSMTLFLLVNMKDRLRILLKPYPIMDARWWNTFCLALSASFRRVEREVADLENQL